MDLILLVLVLALVGFALWAILKYVPMPPLWQTMLQILIVIVIVLYLLRRFGGGLPNLL